MSAPADPFQLDGFVIDGKYRVATVVGDGGFGVVYRGVHKGFGELIAVKCLKIPGALDPSERDALLEQLREEGRILHRLSKVTSGIVQALDVGAFDAPSGAWVPYLVLEWLEGEPLSVLMRRRERGTEGGLSLDDALDLLEPAARALAVAHQQKVAHRDVKPANLFVTEVGGRQTIKVLDFGIAKVLSEHHSKTGQFEATAMGPTAFTPRYGAPEQFNKKRGASGPWTDVFALALIYVELVTAQRALEGDDPTQLYIAAADTSSRPTLRTRGIEASDAVEAVLQKALAVDPRDRWSDAGLFWDALETAVRGAPPARHSRGSRPEGGGARAASGPGEVARAAAEMGATVPAESLPKTPPAAARPGSAAGTSGGAPGASEASEASVHSAGTRRSSDDDPMAETPPPARAAAIAAAAVAAAPARASAGATGARPASPPRDGASPPAKDDGTGGFPWGLAAAGLFVVGAGFAWWTWSSATGGDPRPMASAAPSASVAPKPRTTARPRSTATASAAPSASAVPSASAAPSASAGPPPRFASRGGMVKITSGTFAMGEAAVATTITKDFWIDQNEVTLRQYRLCDDGCSAVDEASPELADWTPKCNATRAAEDLPVNCVDWSSATNFCSHVGKRLPTEAEWELAARGTGGRPFPWGTAEPACGTVCGGRNGDCAGQGVTTCPSGGSAGDRTAEYVFDLGGNVAEWVQDGFVEALPGGSDPLANTAGPTRVVRGGSFAAPLAEARATTRAGQPFAIRHAAIGFRCALDVDAPDP